MKTLLLFLSFICLTVSAQTTEIRVEVNSGNFKFTGNSAEGSTFVSVTEGWSFSNYVNNPYGSKSELGAGVALDVRKVTASKFLFGADLGYEIWRSKILINNVWYVTDATAPEWLDAEGKTNITYHNINLQPFIGYRIPVMNVLMDVTLGSDFAFIVNSKEKTAFNYQNQTVEFKNDRKTISTDIRPRIQLDFFYQKLGLSVGYSFGAINYLKDYDGANLDAKSRIIRFGVSYQLK